MRSPLFLLPLLLFACTPSAQVPAGSAGVAAAAPETRALLRGAPANDAERAVQEMIAADGVKVVHFWAPWCDNSINELAQGWYEVVESNPDVEFAFVTVWNDGAAGTEMLQRYAIPERVRILTQPDGRDESLRRLGFLGLPLTWIPTTWIVRDNGRLAFAFNYGEMTMDQLQAAIESAERDW